MSHLVDVVRTASPLLTVLLLAYVSLRDVRRRRAPTMLLYAGAVALSLGITAGVVGLVAGLDADLLVVAAALLAGAVAALAAYAALGRRFTS